MTDIISIDTFSNEKNLTLKTVLILAKKQQVVVTRLGNQKFVNKAELESAFIQEMKDVQRRTRLKKEQAQIKAEYKKLVEKVFQDIFVNPEKAGQAGEELNKYINNASKAKAILKAKYILLEKEAMATLEQEFKKEFLALEQKLLEQKNKE